MSRCPTCEGSGYLDANGNACDEARAVSACDVCGGFADAPEEDDAPYLAADDHQPLDFSQPPRLPSEG